MRTEKILIPSILVISLLLFAFLSPKLTPFDISEQNLMIAKNAPSLSHIMGTDIYGRDMFSRVIAAGRISVFSALAVVLLMSITGVIVGLFCGYLGGIADTVLMRVSDIFLAFPGLVLAIAAAGLFQNGMFGAIIALASVGWPRYARLARGLVLSIKTSTYINAARLSGSNTVQIVFIEILPNIIGQIAVTASLDIGTSLMELSALSFLGLGATPPTPEWGSMINEGRSLLQIAPWITLSPGVAIFITVSIFNIFGEALRDYYNI
jgi:hypothetical protein